MHENEQDIIIVLTSSYEGNYADDGVEFVRVGISAPRGTGAALVEALVAELPGCSELTDFDFDPETGAGRFILTGTCFVPRPYLFKRAGIQGDGYYLSRPVF